MTRFHFRIGHTEFNFGVPALLAFGISLAAALVLLVYVDVLRASVLKGAAFYEAQRLADTRHTVKKPEAKRSNGTPREAAFVSK